MSGDPPEYPSLSPVNQATPPPGQASPPPGPPSLPVISPPPGPPYQTLALRPLGQPYPPSGPPSVPVAFPPPGPPYQTVAFPPPGPPYLPSGPPSMPVNFPPPGPPSVHVGPRYPPAIVPQPGPLHLPAVIPPGYPPSFCAAEIFFFEKEIDLLRRQVNFLCRNIGIARTEALIQCSKLRGLTIIIRASDTQASLCALFMTSMRSFGESFHMTNVKIKKLLRKLDKLKDAQFLILKLLNSSHKDLDGTVTIQKIGMNSAELKIYQTATCCPDLNLELYFREGSPYVDVDIEEFKTTLEQKLYMPGGWFVSAKEERWLVTLTASSPSLTMSLPQGQDHTFTKVSYTNPEVHYQINMTFPVYSIKCLLDMGLELGEESIKLIPVEPIHAKVGDLFVFGYSKL